MDVKMLGMVAGGVAVAAGIAMLVKQSSSSRAEKRGCPLCEGMDSSCPVCVEGAVLIDVPESMSAVQRAYRMRHHSRSRAESSDPKKMRASQISEGMRVRISDDGAGDAADEEGWAVEVPATPGPWSSYYRITTYEPVTTYVPTFVDPHLNEAMREEEDAWTENERLLMKKRFSK